MNKQAQQIQCYQAIKNAYFSLREKKYPYEWLVGVGVKIYQFHYPDTDKEVALAKAISMLDSDSIAGITVLKN